jgi:uncharacterized protein
MRAALRTVRSWPVRVLIFCIELYRTFISPMRMPTCRFTPTCSEYAVDALRAHGVVRGLVLTVIRLAKCAPWHSGGWDPVPDRFAGSHSHEHSEDPPASDLPTATSHDPLVSVNEQRST